MAFVSAIAALLLLSSSGFEVQSADPKANDAAVNEAMAIADQLSSSGDSHTGALVQAAQSAAGPAPAPAYTVAAGKEVQNEAITASEAAETAKQAAKVSVKVAKHSVAITEHAKSALQNAHDALHKARVDSRGLSVGQERSLKEAEKKLKEATKATEYGQIKDGTGNENKRLQKLENKLKDAKQARDESELDAMRKEIDALRKELETKGDTSDDEALKELQQQIKDMEAAEKKEDKADAKSHDEMKAEIERLRDLIKDLESQKQAPAAPPKEVPAVEERALDIDTAMPFGDLEPFGREDTAQELTENSIKESDEMVDQMERAEVAEEKRAVFRALTRLRGAAITSFDGVARSQTGNIDEYSKEKQWRGTHPLHHLADEESDVEKWAFPDNAD